MPTPAEQVFDSITTEANLQALLGVREEDMHLEFKQKADRRNGKMDDDDKENFSKAVSAFANADGGVLLWGVSITTQHGIDTADELKPITGYKAFAGALETSILATTQPVVDGVRVVRIPTATDDDTGYVKVLVPASDMIPHRAMKAGSQYFRRSQGRTRIVEHVELEDMFGRRPRPALDLVITERPPEEGDIESLMIRFENVGRGSAKDAGAHFEILGNGDFQGVTGDLKNASAHNQGRPVVTWYSQNVIHPAPVARFAGAILLRRLDRAAPVRVRATWYCENMRYRQAFVEFPALPTVMPPTAHLEIIKRVTGNG